MYLLHEVEVVPDVLVPLPLDEILPAHAEERLVEVDCAEGRVLDVGGDGEVEEQVGAVTVAAERVKGLLPVVKKEKQRFRFGQSQNMCKATVHRENFIYRICYIL